MYSRDQWLVTAYESSRAAKGLYRAGNYRSCTSRCYYSTYQTLTAICVTHGDTGHFPPEWNNPSHEQLPGLILNNGDLIQTDRRTIARLVRSLRYAREDADYRPGRTVDETTARNSIRDMLTVRKILGAEDG